MSHRIAGTVAFVSGANRGIGRALVEALLARGAARVYAAARDPRALETLVAEHGDRVVPVALDVTDAASVAAAAARAADVALLLNNAGIASAGGLLDVDAEDALRRQLDVNVHGVLRLTRALAPSIVQRRGAVANLASVASLVNFPMLPTYSISKAATHSLTQGLRAALAPQGVHVAGVYPGPIDTDMARDIPMAKTAPIDAANAILDGIEAGDTDIFPDGMAREFGGAYYADARALERSLTQQATAA